MNTIKPCPFCGAQPKTMVRPDNIDGTEFYAAVMCYCGGHSATAHHGARCKTQAEASAAAIEAWNTRAQAQQADRQRVPDGWKVESMLSWNALTDEANADAAWMATRTKPPFCNSKDERQWLGPTMTEALRRAHSAMGMDFTPPEAPAQEKSNG